MPWDHRVSPPYVCDQCLWPLPSLQQINADGAYVGSVWVCPSPSGNSNDNQPCGRRFRITEGHREIGNPLLDSVTWSEGF